MPPQIQHKRGTSSDIASVNPILLDGEIVFETDTKKFKFGDGSTSWNNLPYAVLPNSGVSISGINIISGSGNFNTLTVSSVPVSVSGHSHTSSNITNFNSSVSGLLPPNIVTGVGTSGYLTRWNGTNSVTSGILFDNGNRIGINTASPSGLLDIAGDVYVRGTGNNLGTIYFKSQAVGDKALYIGATNGGDIVINGGPTAQFSSQGGYLNLLGNTTQIHIGHGYDATNPTQIIRFLPAAKEMMRMTTSGTLGIGLPTSSSSYAGNPVQLFNQQPYANTRVHIAGSGADSGSAALIVTDSSINPLMYVRNDGRIGIGTTTPSGQLHVAGTGIVSSRLGIGTNSPQYSLDVSGSGNFNNVLISGIPLNEVIDDEVANLLVAGSGITLNYNDSANTLTVDSNVSTSLVAGNGVNLDYNVTTDTLSINVIHPFLLMGG